MQVNLSFERNENDPKQGPIQVGWFLTSDKGAILFDAPERLHSREASRTHAKSASRCPAVIQMESRYFVFKSPYDIHVGFGRDKDGKAVLIHRAGEASEVRRSKLPQIIMMVQENEWRFPDRPTVQMMLPYCMIADETVYLTQVGTFAHYRADPLPGTIFGGRFPINIWPRPLMWAFEWHDTKKDLIIRRGEPLFYCQFEGNSPDRPVQLVEAERTPELEAYMEKIGGVVNYVNQTFGLFKAAEEIRPPRLLTTKKK